MNWTKMANGLFVGLMAFFVARCGFMMLSPLIVGFFIAVCLAGGQRFFAFIGGLLGLIGTVEPVDIIRYGLSMLVLGGLLNIKQLMEARGKEINVAFLGGALLTIISLSFRLIGVTKLDILLVALEGGLVFATAIVYLYALKIIKK